MPTTPVPNAARVRRQDEPILGQTSNRATRAASLGLAGVVACLAAFSIFVAYTTQTQGDRARQLAALHASYTTVLTAVRDEQTLEMRYIAHPSATLLAAQDAASKVLLAAVDQIAAQGGAEDAQFVTDLRALRARRDQASSQEVAAIAAGDPVEALRIHQIIAEPVLAATLERTTNVAAQAAAESAAAFEALHRTGQWMLILAPIVFAIGFLLLLGLWRILEGYHRATRETYRQIEQLSKLRSEFVAIVSHEFRTPLTGIQGFSELMRDEPITMPEVREYAADINKDARRLARLITDMLDLDRMESGRMTLISEPVDLNRIVTETAAQFRSSAAKHPIQLVLDERLPELMADPDRLTQVVTNLVSNAIKYSPAGGAVELRTEWAGKTVTLTVRDHGMGIAPDQLENIFARYSRVETTETRAIQGIGLGLPIVRQIVQLSDGRVWATSESGQGSVLHVQLPLVEAIAQRSRAA